ncbi:LysR family transcriptional regulator [Natronincola ferrireducens]|uniref:DNA-binding transcriptional regulator, LysR family n=1 Tax=Natronincola ferrireducens TaxID=393762 RepID=A0A1G8ZVC6_9FIRM|nr:LysR family transcriptional regulator [Natronincola ferrireducens]SDK18941.1 DNA-binding transcriptional regulator, LysR family [Natronincola ferrireducens]
MIDIRVESFLAVWENRSYTKASEKLRITQPAVTQHIKSLEKQYGCKLIVYENRGLKLTKAGEIFFRYAQNAKVNEKNIIQKIREINKETKTMKFAATLTIGEFTIASILGDLVKTFNQYNITMHVDNTEVVLKMLQEGKISFALVEGLFNKADYEARLLKSASFILIAPPTHPLVTKKPIFLHELKNETIIVREKGSGSREVLERGIYEKNYTLEYFEKTIEIGNVNVIKEMVKSGVGLSFMYEDAAREDINKGHLAEVKIQDFTIQREFNFIYLKNQMIEAEIDMFYSFFKNNMI